MKRKRRSIAFKLTFWISGIVVCLLLAGTAVAYFLTMNLYQKSVIDRLETDAALISKAITRIIDGEVEDLRSHVTSPGWLRQVKEANSRYATKTPLQIEAFLQEAEKEWVAGNEKVPAIQKILQNPFSLELEKLVGVDPRIEEIFLTDRYGGLVAASGKTSDFYQADENWWQRAYSGGRGSDIFEDLAFDESTRKMGIVLAIPIRDDSGEVIGVCKQVLDAGMLFKPLQEYRFGKTGHAVLVNQNGEILFHEHVTSVGQLFYETKAFRKIVDGGKKWTVLTDPHIHKGQIMIAFAPVLSTILSRSGILWYVFVDQEKEEIYTPFKHLVFKTLLMVAGLLAFFLLLSYFLGRKLAEPILKLEEAVNAVRQGDWNYPLSIHTGDEVEELADSFQYMVSNIQKKQTDLIKTKEEIEVLSKGLEKKVEERTRELSEAQSATMNILEDLAESNEKMMKYTKELESAKKDLEIQSLGLAKANNDITELYKKLEKQNKELEKADKLKSDFVSIVAHELRNPITIVREMAALILDGLTGPVREEQRYYIEAIKKTGERLIHITNDLLDLAKIEAGKMELQLETFDFLDLVRQVKESVQIRAKTKGLELIEELPGARIDVMLDFEKIFQALQNLLSNAIKFTAKGSVRVKVTDLGKEVECAVEDTGPGISPADVPKLFEKFKQLGEVQIPGQEKGSGLGLAITKSIVEAHQGRIWVESHLGKGSRFIFTLPKHHKVRRKMGQILVDDGIVEKEHVDQALKKQKEEGGI